MNVVVICAHRRDAELAVMCRANLERYFKGPIVLGDDASSPTRLPWEHVVSHPVQGAEAWKNGGWTKASLRMMKDALDMFPGATHATKMDCDSFVPPDKYDGWLQLPEVVEARGFLRKVPENTFHGICYSLRRDVIDRLLKSDIKGQQEDIIISRFLYESGCNIDFTYGIWGMDEPGSDLPSGAKIIHLGQFPNDKWKRDQAKVEMRRLMDLYGIKA